MFGAANPFVQICRRHCEDKFSEIILNLDRCFRRRSFKYIILSRAPAAFLFGGVKPFLQF